MIEIITQIVDIVLDTGGYPDGTSAKASG